MRRAVILLLAVALLAGCGGTEDNGQPDGQSLPPAPGTVAVSAADFGEWQTAAKQATGIDCVTPQFIFGDTGEAVRAAGDVQKVTSKRPPAFQCANGLPFFWATVKNDVATAKVNSDAKTVAAGFDGVKVVDPPSSAPKDASCVAYKAEKRFTCYVPYKNLALMSNSSKSLEDAGAILAGGLQIVEKATS